MNVTSGCNFTANITAANDSACGTPTQGPALDPFAEFKIFAFGSSIYMILLSFITVVANALLLMVFLVDPLKTFKNPTTYFLIGLAISDLLTALIQLPINSTCFIMLYLGGPLNGLVLCKNVLLNVGLIQGAITMTVSFLITLMFTVTQFIVVSSPLKFARMVTSRKIGICVFILYAYSILFWISQFWGVPFEVLLKIDVFLHSLFLPHLTILFYILLHLTFKRKMAASKMLSNESSLQSRESNQNRTQRQFITVNCILITVLFFCSQPTLWFWMAAEFWLPKPMTSQMLIVNLMIDNILFLKFMLDPFVYAWRLPKYREALMKIFPVLKKCKRKPRYEKRIEESKFSQSRETVMTLEIRKIESE